MAGMFNVGEVKVRPGAYSNIQKVGEGSLAGAVDGVTAVLFKSDFGPLNEAVEISAADGYEKTYGTALTTDAVAGAIAGGAKTVICCRIGSGGTASSIVLKDDQDADAVKLEAKYPGAKSFHVSIREMISDDSQKECIVYDGTKEFERVTFAKGGDEAAALAEAFAGSANFTAKKEDGASGVMKTVSQEAFTAGTNPATTVDSYSAGFQAVEAYDFNTICVDTEDTSVHSLLQAFLNRIYEVGQLGMAVIAEKIAIPFETRMAHAAAYNDEKMIYVVNANLETASGIIDGYQTAARVAGMVAACASNKSLTHTVISEVTDLGEKLTTTQVIAAEKSGCLVLTVSPSKQVWIDSAINTLIVPGDNQDEGWKKIRRTKTRYELITRAVTQADNLVGTVDNDSNGRATVVSQIQGIANEMIAEGKLTSCKISESTTYASDGDSCWFDIDAVDKDSAERIYLTFKFRFSTQD